MVSLAGGGGELGDGGPASSAGFCGADDVALDAGGNLCIADLGVECEGPGGNSVRKVDAAGVITTVAGGAGTFGFGSDGGPATKAHLNVPSAVAVGADGLYISDQGNHRIRKVGSDGIITTVAGTGEHGFRAMAVRPAALGSQSRAGLPSTPTATCMSRSSPPCAGSIATG